MLNYFGFVFIAICFTSSCSLEETVFAQRITAKLPKGMYSMAPYYDGESDSIYLFGGTDGSYNLRYILRFNISDETIESVGVIPGVGSATTVSNSEGNIIYFGGSNTITYVSKYDIRNNTVSSVGTLATGSFFSRLAKNSAGNILFFGGQYNERRILEVNIESGNLVSEVVGVLFESYNTTECAQMTNRTVVIFGTSRQDVPYIVLDLDTLETLEKAPNGSLKFDHGMQVTHDKKFVYIFGGDLKAQGMPNDGIIQIDPVTHAWEFHPVENFPASPDAFFSLGPVPVWVEKLDRIYMFGGLLRTYENRTPSFLDDIYYIDLQPVKPTTTTPSPTTTLDPVLFTCDDRIDGTHPHPSDCSKYILCRNETLEGVHNCSPPLLFDPSIRTCNLPSLVDCDLTCEDKTDGIYPHPHDCRLFVICNNREVNVFWCEPPLLFDPQRLVCDHPDSVTCTP